MKLRVQGQLSGEARHPSASSESRLPNPHGDGAFVGQVTDAVFLLSFSFLDGPAPPRPFPACGAGTVADAALGCDEPRCR